MNTIKFDEKSYVMTAQESVLQYLLRHGVNYPNSCQVGVCQSCLMKSEDGVVKAAWQEGLPETLKIQGYFLACMALPDTDIQVAAPNSSECEINARILEIKTLNHNVIQLKLDVENLQDWIPGQYLSLINTEGTMRSYSIANIPSQDGFIELQIKVYSDGSMGQWLVNKAMIHTEVKLRGPFGRCFYFNPDKENFDILLAGTGTGLAPLIAIIKSALSQNHQGNITLVHGGVTDADIYYQNELEALSEKYDSFVLLNKNHSLLNLFY